jgi:23S rRNA (uridine2552-2'-O)-methyltransferase
VIRKLLPRGADIVLSDIAPNTTGHAATDHLRIMALLEMAYDFAVEVLHPGGVFLGKIWQGGAERDLLMRMKKDFAEVRHVKPKASRADSSEMYVMAVGFRK